MELKEIAWVSVDWIDPAQDGDKWRAVSNAVMKFGFRKIPENFLTTWETVSSWRKTLIRGVSLLISSTTKKEANLSYHSVGVRPQGCTISQLRGP